MATTTATRAASTFPVAGGVGNAQSLKVAHGSVTLGATNPALGDIFEMCRVPKGAVVIGGRFYGGQIDGTSTGGALTIHIGDADDTNRFLATVAPTKTLGGIDVPLAGLLFSAGPQTMTSEKVLRVQIDVSATDYLGTGDVLTLEAYYYVP